MGASQVNTRRERIRYGVIHSIQLQPVADTIICSTEDLSAIILQTLVMRLIDEHNVHVSDNKPQSAIISQFTMPDQH
jgi:hypothetical protein